MKTFTMHIVYCDTMSHVIETPCFQDANRQFRKLMREYPDEVIDWDIETTNENGDIIERHRVMQCDPS